MPTGEGGCWREHPQKGMWMAMSEWPRRTRKRRGDESGGQDAPRKAGGGGMEKPKSGAAGGASHTKRQGDVFPLHERPGPHGPPDVVLPVMGMPQKGIGGTIRNASFSPFSGDALCFIPKAAIRGVGRSPGKGVSLWHSSCLTSRPMYWPASSWRSLSAASGLENEFARVGTAILTRA